MDKPGFTRKQLLDELGTLRTSIEELHQLETLQAEILAKEHLFSERLLNSSANLCCSVDASGVILTINDRFAELLGYLPENLAGGNLFDHVGEHRREDYREALSLAANSGFYRTQMCFRSSEGTERCCEFRLVLDDRHNPLRIHALAEAPWEGTLNDAPVMLWIAESSEVWSFANRRCSEFIGVDLSCDAQAIWLERVHDADVESLMASRRNATGIYHATYRIRSTDGLYRQVLELGTAGGMVLCLDLREILDRAGVAAVVDELRRRLDSVDPEV